MDSSGKVVESLEIHLISPVHFTCGFHQCIPPVYFTCAFHKCISAVYFTSVFHMCLSQVHFTSVFHQYISHVPCTSGFHQCKSSEIGGYVRTRFSQNAQKPCAYVTFPMPAGPLQKGVSICFGSRLIHLDSFFLDDIK